MRICTRTNTHAHTHTRLIRVLSHVIMQSLAKTLGEIYRKANLKGLDSPLLTHAHISV